MKKKSVMKLGAFVMSAALLTTSLAGCGSADTAEAAEAARSEETSEAETIVTEALTQSVGSGSSANAGSEAKEETVYVFTNASGEQTSVLVNEKLKNISDTDVIEDLTTLTDIENLTGDETYTTGDGDAITWDYDGNDITYRGTTDAETPVSIKVTYYLNGEEISPEDLAGQSGEVRIRFDYTNNEMREITVNGETKEAYVPFTVMTGMLLDGEHFSNIEVTNGNVTEMSSGNLVVGVAVPGLSESLDLDSYGDDGIDIDIPEYFEVTATATDFELDMTMSVVSGGLLSDVDVDDLTLDDLTESLDELKDATAELIDGTEQLADGTQELKDGTQELADGAQDLKDGTQELADGARDLKDGTQSLADGASTLRDGTQELADGADSLSSGASSLKSGTQTLADSMPTLSEGVTQLDDGAGSLASGAEQVDEGASSLEVGIDTLADSVETQLVPGVEALDEGVQQLAAAVSGMGDTLDQGIEAQKATLNEQLAAQKTTLAALGYTGEADADHLGDIIGFVKNMRDTAYVAKTVSSGDAMYQTLAGYYDTLDAMLTTLYQAQYSLAGAQTTVAQVKNALNANADSLAALVAGSAQLRSSIGSFDASSLQAAIADGNATTVCAALYRLRTGAARLSAGTSALSSGADTLKNGTTSLKSSSETLVNGVNSLNSGAGSLSSGASQLKSGADSLNSGAGALKSGADTLNSGAGTLLDGANELNDGAGDLQDGVTELNDGADELNDGAIELRDGMKEYDEDGIQKLTDLVDEDANELLETFKAIIALGQDYQSFAGKPDTLDGSVVFIYRMDGISKENLE